MIFLSKNVALIRKRRPSIRVSKKNSIELSGVSREASPLRARHKSLDLVVHQLTLTSTDSKRKIGSSVAIEARIEWGS